MPEAKIHLTLAPREFDVVRAALDTEYSRCLAVADDRHTDVALRQTHRRAALELNDILSKLR